MTDKLEKKSGLTAEEYQRCLLEKSRRGAPDCDFFLRIGIQNDTAGKVHDSILVPTKPVTNVNDGQCITTTKNETLKKNEVVPPEAELRRQYDEAFDQTFEGIDEYAFNMDSTAGYLKAIRDFKREHVGWVEIVGDDYVEVASDGIEDKIAKMAIVPSGHKFDRMMGSFCGLSPDGRNVLLIKSLRLPKMFKAIALMDRLYYLYAKTAGLEPLAHPDKSQFLNTEKGSDLCVVGALDFCSNGKFFEVAEAFLKANRLKSVDEILYAMRNYESYIKMIRAVDAQLPGEKGMGKTEVSIRAGMYIRALVIYMAVNSAEKNGEDVEAAVLVAVEKFMRGNGHGRNIPV